MTVQRLATVAATVGVLALSACAGGSDASAPEPTPSTSATSSPSPSATEPALAQKVMAEPPERPEDKKTPKGAEAFATYVVEVLHYSIQQRDFSLLNSLMSEEGSCVNCANVESAVEKSANKGKLDLMTEPVRVKGARLIDKQNWVVGVLYRRPETVRVDEEGARLKTFPAENDRYIEMGLVWQGDTWAFYNFRFGED